MRRPPVLLLLGLLVGCDLEQAEESSVSEFHLATESGVRPTVSVRLERGSIEIRGSETNRVEAMVKKRARSVDPDAAQALLGRIQIATEQTGDRIRIVDHTQPPAGSGFAMELRADLTLRVPPDTDLDLRTNDGSIRIEQVDGKIVANTGDGRISLKAVRGSSTLRSGDGSITVDNLQGELDAQTDDGSIEISGTPTGVRAVTSDGRIRVSCGDGTAPAGEWLLHTADGSIELSLPPSVSANLDATTSSGRIDNGLSSFQGTEHHRRLAGRIGGGGPLIVISTMDGHVELRDSSR